MNNVPTPEYNWMEDLTCQELINELAVRLGYGMNVTDPASVVALIELLKKEV